MAEKNLRAGKSAPGSRSTFSGKDAKRDRSAVSPQRGFVFDGFDMGTYFSPLIPAEAALWAELEFTKGIFLYCFVCMLAVVVIIQLRVSKPAVGDSQYFDKLPSIKLYKSKFVNGLPGQVFASMVGFVRALPFIMADKNTSSPTPADLGSLIQSQAEASIPSAKRIKVPSPGNWRDFAAGESGAAVGYLISCPTTNIKFFNLNTDIVLSFTSAEKVLEYFSKCLPSHVLNFLGLDSPDGLKAMADSASKLFSSTFLSNAGGLPITASSLSFDEPKDLSSALEVAILGQPLGRTASIVASVPKGGIIPEDTKLSREQLVQHLTPMELNAYDIAIKMGTTSILKHFNDKVLAKVNATSSSPSPASPSASPPPAAAKKPGASARQKAQGAPRASSKASTPQSPS